MNKKFNKMIKKFKKKVYLIHFLLFQNRKTFIMYFNETQTQMNQNISRIQVFNVKYVAKYVVKQKMVNKHSIVIAKRTLTIMVMLIYVIIALLKE